MSAAQYELRPDGGDICKIAGMGASLDEIVAKNVRSVHFERMDNNCYWCGIDLTGGAHIRVIIQATRANVHMWAEVENADG